jgi:paraquat-inducible protein A
LRRTQKNSLDRTIAWGIAGLILYFVAVYFPFLAMQSHGISNETALISGIVTLYGHGMSAMSLVVLLTCLIFPLFSLISLLYVLLPIKLNRRLPGAANLFAWNQRLRPWGMVEVYMLGILVSMVKLTKLARIIPGPAFYSFIALIFVLAASSVSLDSYLVWDFFHSSPEVPLPKKRQ